MMLYDRYSLEDVYERSWPVKTDKNGLGQVIFSQFESISL